MSQWRDIATAPTDGTEVLVFQRRKHGNVTIANARNTHGSQWWARHIGCMHPSHWQPLPSPPVIK